MTQIWFVVGLFVVGLFVLALLFYGGGRFIEDYHWKQWMETLGDICFVGGLILGLIGGLIIVGMWLAG